MKDRPAGADGSGPDPMFRKFKEGDPGASARAADQAARVIALHGFSIPRDQRADLVQDVMVEMWERTRGPSLSPGRTFDAYVRTLAYWRCIDWLRHRKSETAIDPDMPGRAARPDAALLGEERRRIGRAVIRALRRSCRELIRLHAGRGLKYRVIAERLGRSEGALRVQMVGCLKEARRIRDRILRGGKAIALGRAES